MLEDVSNACKIKTGSDSAQCGCGSELEKNLDDFNRACRNNRKELFGYAYSLVGSADEAEDIVQQAFTNTLSAIEKGVQVHTMGGFIYRCVDHLSMRHIGREPDSLLIEDTPLTADQSAATTAEGRSRARNILSILDHMPQRQRFAFLQAELKGYSYQEMAEAIDL